MHLAHYPWFLRSPSYLVAGTHGWHFDQQKEGGHGEASLIHRRKKGVIMWRQFEDVAMWHVCFKMFVLDKDLGNFLDSWCFTTVIDAAP